MAPSKLLLSLLLSVGLAGCLINQELYEERAEALSDDDADGFTGDQGDCNDNDLGVFPGATETCNGTDDDCDGTIDNDPVDGAVWYPDEDDDGYGDDASPQTTCEDTTDLLTTGGDCDDTDDAVNPDAEEICNDRVDNDCSGSANHCVWAAEIDMREGLLIEADYADDGLAYSGTLGDLNGDGTAELILSSYYAYVEDTGTRPGTIQAFDLPITESLTRLDADRFFTGENDADAFGVQLTVLDLDGDGYDDLVSGARSHDPDGINRAGSTFVFYGPITSDVLATDADWALQGETESGRLGEALGSIGDFNDDGLPDFGSGSHYFPSFDDVDEPGLVHIYTDAGSGVERAAGAAYLMVYGAEDSISLGSSLVGMDINGDGLDELLLGADEGEGLYGAVYLFENERAGSLSTADADLMWRGETYVSYTGGSIDNIGDVNSDGVDDVLIGARQAGDGSAYIIWGSSDPALATLADADITFRGTLGGGRNFGNLVSGIGDINEDGAPDILIGEGGVAPNDVYVFYGPLSASMVLAETDADVVLTGDPDEDEDYNLAIGDVDLTGDGVHDLLVGSDQNDLAAAEGEWAGTAYIIPGVGL